MKCEHCHRTLTRFAAALETPAGTIGWGPVCARTVLPRATRRAAVVTPLRRGRPDPRQVDWIEGAAA